MNYSRQTAMIYKVFALHSPPRGPMSDLRHSKFSFLSLCFSSFYSCCSLLGGADDGDGEMWFLYVAIFFTTAIKRCAAAASSPPAPVSPNYILWNDHANDMELAALFISSFYSLHRHIYAKVQLTLCLCTFCVSRLIYCSQNLRVSNVSIWNVQQRRPIVGQFEAIHGIERSNRLEWVRINSLIGIGRERYVSRCPGGIRIPHMPIDIDRVEWPDERELGGMIVVTDCTSCHFLARPGLP